MASESQSYVITGELGAPEAFQEYLFSCIKHSEPLCIKAEPLTSTEDTVTTKSFVVRPREIHLGGQDNDSDGSDLNYVNVEEVETGRWASIHFGVDDAQRIILTTFD